MKKHNLNILRICVVGIFPPPTHGMSSVTEFFFNKFSQDFSSIRVDYSPRSLNRSGIYHATKMIAFFLALARFSRSLLFSDISAVYIGVSIGKGQIYDLPFILLSRIFNTQLLIHHHGYTYIDKPSHISALLFLLAGKNSVHICACDRMAKDLTSQYKSIKNYHIVSALVTQLSKLRPTLKARTQLRTIGYISNISKEKGIIETIEIAKRLYFSKSKLTFIIAGPFQNDAIKTWLLQEIDLLPNVQYAGPLYNRDKEVFFDSIDALLFPTHSEAEGLVIHESLAHSVPVISYNRGCISDFLSDSSGLIIEPHEDFVCKAIEKIKCWESNPLSFSDQSKDAFNSHLFKLKKTQDQIDSFLEKFKSIHVN